MVSPPDAQVVGAAQHYRAFIELCRRRIEQLNITYDVVDEVCGFPQRYTSKVMAGCKGLSAYSLFILINGLALLPAFHHDAQTLANHQRREAWTKLRRPGPRWRRKRNGSQHFGTHHFGPDLLRMVAVKGGLARSRKMTARQRRDSARHAATVRWSRTKASETPGATHDSAQSRTASK